jgi:hypothetical protein
MVGVSGPGASKRVPMRTLNNAVSTTDQVHSRKVVLVEDVLPNL